MMRKGHLYRLAVAALALAAVSARTALAVGVGETAPFVILEGLDATGNLVASAVTTRDKADQKFTVVGFFSIEDAGNAEALGLLTKEAAEYLPTATTRLVSSDADLKAVRAYREANKAIFGFNLALDPRRNAYRAFGITRLPTLLVVDADDKVRVRVEGPITKAAVNPVRTVLGLKSHALQVGVGDTAPQISLAVRYPSGAQSTRDITRPDTGHRTSVVSIGSIYSTDNAKNLSVLRNLAASYGRQSSVRFVSVDANTTAVLNYVRQYATFFQYGVVLDPQGTTLSRLLEKATPLTYVLDGAGKVLFKKAGQLTAADAAAIGNLVR